MTIIIKQVVKKILQKLGLFDLIIQRIKGEKPDKIDIIYDEDKRQAKKPKSETDIIERRLWVKVHAIEKQIVLNHLPSIKAAGPLIDDLRILLSHSSPIDFNIVVDGISVLNEWARHASETRPEDCRKIQAKVSALAEEFKIDCGRCNTIHIKEIDGFFSDENFNYEAFVCSRHSMREYSPDIVQEKKILEIIELARYCPSACNRQPWKVYYSIDPETLNALKKLCVDQFVARNVYNFLVITVNKDFFSEQGEVFQSWINGGIFANSLSNSIHAKGLGSCLFQTAKSNPKYEEIKMFLDIPKKEDIICMVGFGYLKDKVRFINTHRKSVESIAVKR